MRKFTIGAVFAALWLACGAQAKADIILGSNALGQNQYETFATYTQTLNSHIQEMFTVDFRNGFNTSTNQQVVLVTVSGAFNQLVGSNWLPVNTLTNPMPNNLDNGLALSSIFFTPLSAGAQIIKDSGYQAPVANVSGNNTGKIGTATSVNGAPGNQMLGWSVQNNAGVTTLDGSSPGGPDHLIVPYITNAIWNSAVKNESPVLLASISSDPNDPNYVNDPNYAGVQFVLSDSNAMYNVSNLASLSLQFKTTEGANIIDITPSLVHLPPVNPSVAVPEPSSLALLGLGGIGLAVKSVRRRRQQAA